MNSCIDFVLCYSSFQYLSLCMRKPTIWVPTKSDTNWTVQSQKMVRGWKFWILKVDELYYLCSKNKGADQLRSYCLCFRLCRLLSFPCGGSLCDMFLTANFAVYIFIPCHFKKCGVLCYTLRKKFAFECPSVCPSVCQRFVSVL